MTDYESQTERDTLVRLVGQDSALRVLWESNHCLQVLLADTEARVKDTEEQLNSTERLLNKRNSEMDRLIAAIDAERADYQRFRSLAGEEANAAREINAAATEERDFWKSRANELSDRMVAEVQPLLVGDPLVFAALAYRDAKGEPTSRKITAIKALRSYTGLGLREAKLAVEQVIKIVEMKEAAA